MQRRCFDKILSVYIKGFSLIELMVVVAIIALLAMAATPSYKQYVMRSNVAKAQTYAQGVLTELKEYYVNHARFPTDVAEIYPVEQMSFYNVISGVLPIEDDPPLKEVQISLELASSSNQVVAVWVKFIQGMGYDQLETGGWNSSLVWLMYEDQNGTLITKCGLWGDANPENQIKESLVPAQCTERNMYLNY